MADTVMVACKAPNGLVLDLDAYEVSERDQRVRVIKSKMAPVTLKGWSVPFGIPELTTGGYALTEVPTAFWDEWWARNKDSSSLIEDKIILPPHKDAIGSARDHAAVPQMFARRKESEMLGAEKLTAS